MSSASLIQQRASRESNGDLGTLTISLRHARTFSHEGKSSPLAGEGGGCTPTPSHYIYGTITSKVAVYALADTLTLFHLLENMYSVVTPST